MKRLNNYQCRTSNTLVNQLHLLWRLAIIAGFVILFANISAFAQKGKSPAASLEQIRNGSAIQPVQPAQWQNGNAGNQTAHYVESHSIGYRALLTNLPVGETVTLILGYDVKHSNRNAIDFLTHYDRLQPHGQFLSGGQHPAQETVDPRLGTSFAGMNPTSTFEIPRPVVNQSGVPGSVWQEIKNSDPDKVKMTMWGGTITNIQYVTPGADLSLAQSEQRIAVTFIIENASAVLAWGGHIANRNDWGYDVNNVPLSAGGISGSPYHMRLINWGLGNLGNQDRSLSAAAVIPPPLCTLTGDDNVCAGSTNTYSTTEVADTYTWTIINNTSGAAFNPEPTSTSQSVTIDAGANAGSYTVKLVTTRNGITSTEICEIPVTVNYPPTNNVTDRIHCHGEAGTAIAFSSPVNGVTFAWTSTANIGFGTSGSGDIGAYTASNNTTEQVVATITVTATINGCAGPAETFTVTVNPNPTITAPSIGAVCQGATSASVSYTSVTIGANQYKIVWNAAAVSAGLVSMTNFAALPSSPFSLTIPSTLATTTYQGTIYVRNSTTTCESAGVPISLTVNSNPTVTVNSPTICSSALPATITATPGSGAASDYNYAWTVPSGATAPGNVQSFTTSTAGTYSVIITRKTTGCSSPSASGTLNVNANPGAPDAEYLPPACDETTFKVKVNSPSSNPVIVGATYTLKKGDGTIVGTYTPATSAAFTFAQSIVAGAGFKVSVETTEACSSGEYICPTPTAMLNTSSAKTLQNAERISMQEDQATAYPIPFYDRTTIEFRSESSGKYVIHLYDMKGTLIKELKSGVVKAGETQSIEVDGKDLTEGMYLARIVSGSGSKTVKLLKRK